MKIENKWTFHGFKQHPEEETDRIMALQTLTSGKLTINTKTFWLFWLKGNGTLIFYYNNIVMLHSTISSLTLGKFYKLFFLFGFFNYLFGYCCLWLKTIYMVLLPHTPHTQRGASCMCHQVDLFGVIINILCMEREWKKRDVQTIPISCIRSFSSETIVHRKKREKKLALLNSSNFS